MQSHIWESAFLLRKSQFTPPDSSVSTFPQKNNLIFDEPKYPTEGNVQAAPNDEILPLESVKRFFQRLFPSNDILHSAKGRELLLCSILIIANILSVVQRVSNPPHITNADATAAVIRAQESLMECGFPVVGEIRAVTSYLPSVDQIAWVYNETDDRTVYFNSALVKEPKETALHELTHIAQQSANPRPQGRSKLGITFHLEDTNLRDLFRNPTYYRPVLVSIDGEDTIEVTGYRELPAVLIQIIAMIKDSDPEVTNPSLSGLHNIRLYINSDGYFSGYLDEANGDFSSVDPRGFLPRLVHYFLHNKPDPYLVNMLRSDSPDEQLAALYSYWLIIMDEDITAQEFLGYMDKIYDLITKKFAK